MIHIENDHFSRAAGSSPGFNGSRIAIKPLEEAHDPAGKSTAGEGFVHSPYIGIVGTHSAAALEKLRFGDILLADGMLPYQGIPYGKDKAGGGLGAGVTVFSHNHLS